MKIVYRATVGDYKAAHRMLRRENWFLRYDQLIWWLVLSLFIAVGVATGEVSLITSVRRDVLRLSANLCDWPSNSAQSESISRISRQSKRE